MGQKLLPGLRWKNGIAQIDKQVDGRRIYESTGARTVSEANRYLTKRLEEIRQATVYGVRPKRTFREAGVKYVETHAHKRSIEDAVQMLRTLDCFIGGLELDRVHDESLLQFVSARREAGRKCKTINEALSLVRRILNLCATSWRDEYGLTWLHQAPKITMLTVTDAAKPYPLTWEQQRELFQRLPSHLAAMSLFKVNSGCREQEVCKLMWAWEQGGCFVLPGSLTKNGESRVVPLNSIARRVVASCRGAHPEYVFTYTGRPITKMNNTAWKRAWREAGLPVTPEYRRGVHNLRHTFARRLRAAGVPHETRQALLGHRNGDITIHYSPAELQELTEAVERLCVAPGTMLREVG